MTAKFAAGVHALFQQLALRQFSEPRACLGPPPGNPAPECQPDDQTTARRHEQDETCQHHEPPVRVEQGQVWQHHQAGKQKHRE